MLADISPADIYRFKYAGGESEGPVKRLLIPLFMESVAAGFPSPAADFIEANLDLNELCIEHPVATFFVRVRGLSMVGAGIQPGDLVVVDRSVEATSGTIVLALLENEFTLKRLKRTADNRLWLLPDNPEFEPVQIKEEMHFEVWGVVVSVIHFFGGRGKAVSNSNKSSNSRSQPGNPFKQRQSLNENQDQTGQTHGPAQPGRFLL